MRYIVYIFKSLFLIGLFVFLVDSSPIPKSAIPAFEGFIFQNGEYQVTMEEVRNALMMASRIDGTALSNNAPIYYTQDYNMDRYGFNSKYTPPRFHSPLDEDNWPIHESIDFMIYNPARG